MFSKLNKVVLLCCIHATFALFYCLLLNLNLNSYEFEFKLNVFESFQKWKSLPFSPLLFSPAGPSLLSRGPENHPAPAQDIPQPGPVGTPSPAPADRRAPPVEPVLFLRLKRDSSSGSPGRARPAAPCRDPHAKMPRPSPYISAALPP